MGLDKLCGVVHTHIPKLKKWEIRAGTDTELKLNDLLRYYDHETSAAKDLLYRLVFVIIWNKHTEDFISSFVEI